MSFNRSTTLRKTDFMAAGCPHHHSWLRSKREASSAQPAPVLQQEEADEVDDEVLSVGSFEELDLPW